MFVVKVAKVLAWVCAIAFALAALWYLDAWWKVDFVGGFALPITAAIDVSVAIAFAILSK